MRSRVLIAFLIAVVSCLALAASASACQIVHLQLDDSAGPGDTVSYSISGIEQNSEYSFTIAGEEISGINRTTNPGVSGTFTMPDLGSQQLTLTAHGTCTCPQDANEQPLVDDMQYLPPTPAAPPASGSSHGSDSTPATAVPSQSSPPAKTAAKKHTRVASPTHPAAVPSAQGSSSGTTLGTEVAAPQSEKTRSDSAPEAKAKGRSDEASSSVPTRVLDTIGGTTSVGPAKVPTLGLLAIALILIAGLGLAGLAIYIFRNGPDPDAAFRDPAPTGPDPIEAELQQIIADEMARQLVSDLNLGEPTKVSSK